MNSLSNGSVLYAFFVLDVFPIRIYNANVFIEDT